MIFSINNNKIYHMASMARSGETLMLKILSVNENVVVVHNLDEVDDTQKEKSFQFLKTYKSKKISRKHPLFAHYGLNKNQILLLKQGVWEHKYPFQGFILARNPVSIYSSLKSYDQHSPEYDVHNNFWFNNTKRFKRWLLTMDPALAETIDKKTPLEQFTLFYNLRMGNLYHLNLPIIRYEDLITKTVETVSRVCNILNISFNEEMLNAHNNFKSGEIGHGNNDLSKPIDKKSLTKYKENVSAEEFEYLAKSTSDIYGKYGYILKNNEIITS